MLYVWLHKDSGPSPIYRRQPAARVWAVSTVSPEDAKAQALERVLSLSEVDSDLRDDPRRVIRDGYSAEIPEDSGGLLEEFLKRSASVHY